jgi:hypothetical protein
VSGTAPRTGGSTITRFAALITVTVLGILVLAGCGEKEENLEPAPTTAASDPTAEIAGDWTGQLAQKGLAPFQVAVRIEASGTAQVAYTGINCGGAWTPSGAPVASTGPAFTFEETIDRGAGGTCKGSGTVVVTHEPNDALRYRFTGGGVTSRGVLQRTDAPGLRPVFEHAGLPPPA